jgi:hypothetical protein
VKVQKVAPFTSAPDNSIASNRGSRSDRSSCRALVSMSMAPAGTDRRIPMIAGTETSATAQNADRQPHNWPSTAPAGTPATQARVTPASRMDVARPLASGLTMPVAATSATARNPALASAPTTRVASNTA